MKKNNHDGFILRPVKIILLNLPFSTPVENRHNPAPHSTTTSSTCRHNFVPTPNSAVPQSGTVSAGAQSKYTGPVVHTDCSSRLRAAFAYHVLTWKLVLTWQGSAALLRPAQLKSLVYLCSRDQGGDKRPETRLFHRPDASSVPANLVLCKCLHIKREREKKKQGASKSSCWRSKWKKMWFSL